MAVATTYQAASGALEPRLYLDPEVLEQEQEHIFERTWQLAGHEGALPKPGAYLTAQAGDQPVLVVRDDENQVRAFRNVCRHRGSRLLAGSGQCKRAIRCRYHGWTYRLDGSLIGVPEARSFPGGIDKSEFGLFPVRTEIVGGLIFVNLDAHAEPLTPQLGDLPALLERYRLAHLECFWSNTSSQPVNWKIVADNYLEGYHIPIGHPGLMRLLDYQHYDLEVHDAYVRFDAPLRPKRSSNLGERVYQRIVQPMPGLGPDDRDVWRYVFIWPNTTIDLYPDQIGTWQLGPDGVASTRDVFASYRNPKSGPRTRIAQRINIKLNTLVYKEDVDLVENVQAGMVTRDYMPGPLSQREGAVAWFADHVRAALAE